MTISFNHTIVASRDKHESAAFLAELFGLPSQSPSATSWLSNSSTAQLDYADAPEGADVPRQHYAFLVSEQEFDTIYDRIQSRGLQHWADPGAKRPGEINHNHGGRGVYFPDPSGHAMQILTSPEPSAG